MSTGTIAPDTEPILQTVRIIDAPRRRVFEAFSEEEHITQWWGPRGFSNRDTQWNFKVGGQWIFTMHHDEHGDFPNVVTFTEIVEDELIAFDHGEDLNSVLFKSRIAFEDEGDKTRLTMTMTFPSYEIRDQLIEDVGALEGQKETFDKLEEFLSKGK